MSVESLIFQTLRGLVSDRVYPDIAPPGVVALPRITYQAVGGTAVNFLGNDAPSMENSRQQVNVWGATRLQVSALMKQVKAAMRAESALHTTVLGEPVSVYESETKLYGAHQDFSVWTTTST